MKYILSIIIFLSATCLCFPKNIGINSDGATPNTSAGLDISFTDKGLLIPRISLTGINDAATITTPATSLLVYSTNTNVAQMPHGAGYYYNSGTSAAPVWTKLITHNEGAFWNLAGNAGTNDTFHFFGTTDNIPLNFRVNNQTAGKIQHQTPFQTAFGYQALNANTTGARNTAVGYQSLQLNTTGIENVAMGHQSLNSNTTGLMNTALGNNTLLTNSTGSYNTAIGNAALSRNTTGASNTATGKNALYNNTTGANNTAHGAYALATNTTGNRNTAVGNAALSENTTGRDNTAVGNTALFANSTGYANVAIGAEALPNNTSGIGNTAAGTSSLMDNTSGSRNTALGAQALLRNTVGDANTAIGYATLRSNQGGTNNTAIGYFALGGVATNYDYFHNTAIGANSLINNGIGNYNTGIGSSSLNSCYSGSENTAVGYYSLVRNFGGSSNTAVGYQALRNNYWGNRNIGIGHNAGQNLGESVSNVVCVGFNSGFASTPDNHINIGNSSNTWIGGQVTWGTYSDARIKEDVQENVPGLSFIKELRPVTYHLNITKQDEIANEGIASDTAQWTGKYDIEKITQTGFLAQEVEAAAQKTGFDFNGVYAPKDGRGLYSLSYASFTVPLVKAVQEQQEIIEEQSATIDDLKMQLQKLQQQMQHLLNRLEN